MHAKMQWCPSPDKFAYKKPIVDLTIDMEELSLQLTKYQYHDFVQLLQSLEYVSRASQFRKYKARHGLENLPNYHGKLKDMWKFAFDCVYEEEVVRKINNWSWTHMRNHLKRCKEYRKLYKIKLTAKKIDPALVQDLENYEKILDEVNIRLQRQLAERELDQKIQAEKIKKAESSSGGFWSSWWSGSAQAEQDKADKTSLMKKFELTAKDKEELFQVLDYQENAHHGIYPKSFVAYQLAFELKVLKIKICDEEKKDATVLQLNLQQVNSSFSQRPSADCTVMFMQMKSLGIQGLRYITFIKLFK